MTPDGTIKLLDFGLAKATEETAANPANSPTISLTMTQAVVILGVMLQKFCKLIPAKVG